VAAQFRRAPKQLLQIIASGIYWPVIFSPAILNHFKNPHNTGEILDATARVDVTNPVCGDALRLSVRMAGERIEEARFKAQGCVAAIAASSVLTDLLSGKTLEEARRITPQQISEELGGLPPATFHAAQLCCDAIGSLLKGV
jgi:nitrogen fixation protein NifU and related proteins